MSNEGGPKVIEFFPRFVRQKSVDLAKFIRVSGGMSTRVLIATLKNPGMAEREGAVELAWEINRRFPDQPILNEGLIDWAGTLSGDKKILLTALMTEAAMDSLGIPEEQRGQFRTDIRQEIEEIRRIWETRRE